ncbi:MAG: mannose-1-phosphate guanylyltransferase [Sphingomonadaceae bacterium]
MSAIVPVILCGGSGTRLWPRSRKARPKPFLPLVGERTLFQQALDRCDDPAQFAAPLVVAGEAHVPLICEQGGAQIRIAVEPSPRNTAPAIALAAALLESDAVMLVCPSDHHIADIAAFREAARAAAALAQQDRMVAFGIAPDRPETGYGYILRGAPLAGGFRVERFVEKPDRATAEGFLAHGGYSWNGGIFAFRAGAFLAELAAHRPDMTRQVREAAAQGTWVGARFDPAAAPWQAISAESVDYAVMENTARAAMVPASLGWSDIGNWQALHAARGGNELGNHVTGQAELVDCRSVMVETDGPRVSVVGLEGVIVVVDGGEVLVTSAEGAQQVGHLAGARDQ